jgi:2-phosphosulfolactate phosphatase
VTVIAAGERWPGGELRPAVEDLWGAGAFISALGSSGLSPEATAAAGAFGAMGPPSTALMGCASGRELVAGGYVDDVVVAAGLDEDDAVPVLRGNRFVPLAVAGD